MGITKAIGKNTLGGGKRMNVDLRTYNRSTHDMSYIWRNTQSPGTLVPFICELAQKGDTWEFDMNHTILTHPTIGPLFGSFKVQADIFQCPIRLYNALLHNNALNIGLNMKKALLPQIQAELWRPDNEKQINESCLLSYLGIRGYGIIGYRGMTTIDKNATAIIGYYDIFKNYYANKQEEYFYTIANNKTIDYVIATDVTGIPDPNNLIGETIERWIGIPVKYRKIGSDYYLYTNSGSQEQMTIAYKINDIATSISTEAEWMINGELTVVEVFKTNTGTNDNVTKIINVTQANTKSLNKYKLEEIDNTREDILSKGADQFLIYDIDTSNSKYPQNYLFDLARKQWGAPAAEGATYGDLPYTGKQRWCTLNTAENQAGLCVKTYQSDIFNNWINTEWIDGENGINAITAVKIDPTSQSFQLDTLNLAKKVYDMLNRIAVSGGTYQDWLETVYTGDATFQSETPIYEGGFSGELEFQEVVSNASTTDEPLGTLAGRGRSGNQKGGKVIVKVNEPGYIIGIISLTPRLDYCQGNRFDTQLRTLDDMHKPALDAIGFQDRMCETLDWRSVYIDEEEIKQNASIGKQPAWIDYMTNFNRTFGNFAIKDNEAFMVLNRWYESNAEKQTGDYSSYIDPEKYNYIFADTDLNAMNFWVQVGVNATLRRIISAKVIPNL